MKIAMIRVGVDAGAEAGGIQGPLFRDRTFEFIPIPETPGLLSKHTYGNLIGRHGRPLSDYFPPRRQAKMSTPQKLVACVRDTRLDRPCILRYFG